MRIDDETIVAENIDTTVYEIYRLFEEEEESEMPAELMELPAGPMELSSVPNERRRSRKPTVRFSPPQLSPKQRKRAAGYAKRHMPVMERFDMRGEDCGQCRMCLDMIILNGVKVKKIILFVLLLSQVHFISDNLEEYNWNTFLTFSIIQFGVK